MGEFGIYGIIALIIAAIGFFLGHKGKGDKPVDESGAMDEAKEILNEHVEEVRKAGSSYSSDLARPVDDRIRDILRWYRDRTGSDKRGDG